MDPAVTTLPMVAGSQLPESANEMVDPSQEEEDTRTLAEVIDEYKIVRVQHWQYACSCIPYDGVLFTFIMLIVSYVSSLSQAFILVASGEYIYAGLLGICLGACLYYQKLMMSFKQAWSFARKSGDTGIMELDLLLFFSLGTHIKHGFTLFLAPYPMLKNSNLGLLGFAICSMSLLSGCKIVSTELMRSHLGAYYYQFGRALVNRQSHGQEQLCLLQLWTLSTISSQVAFNALFMYVFHPMVLFLLYLPVALVNFYFGPAEHTAFTRFREAMLEPVNLLAAFRSSVFGFGQWDPFANVEQGNQPALHHCVAQILRIIMMLVLMCFDFPMAPIRPMGLGVLHRELLVPVKTCIEESSERFAGGVQHNFCPMGSSAYKALLELMVVLGLPLHMVGVVMMLLKSPYFRTGRPNAELNDAKSDMFSDVAQRLPEDSNGDGHGYHDISSEVPAAAL